MKVLFKDLLGKDIAVKCDTKEKFSELIKHFVSNYNPDDTCKPHFWDDYEEETCVNFESTRGGEYYEWAFCNNEFYSRDEDWKVINFEDVDFNIRKRGFELVTDSMRKHPDKEIKLPLRGTSTAMAYDFFSPITVTVQPNEIVKIWSDVKAYMQSNECLILNVRSSMGGKFMFANTQGWIDADYYNNENNEGNIGLFLKNISNEPITINQGDRVGQGAFFNFLVSDNGNPEEEIKRKGGFGSSGR